MNYPFDNDIKKTVSDTLNSVHASDDLIAETLKRLQLEGLVSKDDTENEKCAAGNKKGSVRTRLLGFFTLGLIACALAAYLTIM